MEKRFSWGLVGVGLAVVAFFLTVQSWVDPGLAGFPLDDSWIHLSFARNLAHTGVFGINPGEPSNGSTSPLWTILLAGGCFLGAEPGTFAHLAGALLIFLTVFALYRLVFLLTQEGRIALLCSLVTLLSGRFIWGGLSGMEIPLFSFLSITALYYHERSLNKGRVSLLAFCFFGLASLTRPEGHLLFVLALLDIVFRSRFPFKEKGMRLCAGAGIYILMSLPYMFFSWELTRRLLCGSYYSKMSFLWTLKPWDYLAAYFRPLFMDNPFLFLGVVPGLRGLWSKKQRLIPLWVTVLPLCSAFIAPLMFHHGRYNMPLAPLYVMAGAIGLMSLPRRWLRLGAAVLVLAWALYFIKPWALRYACDVSSINSQHVKVALWLKRHTLPGEGVAANDVGAIAALSGRRVVDLCGIMDISILNTMRYGGSPSMQRVLLRHFLQERGVKHLAIYREWFPWIVDDPDLEKVFEARVEDNTAAGCEMMEVFLYRRPCDER